MNDPSLLGKPGWSMPAGLLAQPGGSALAAAIPASLSSAMPALTNLAAVVPASVSASVPTSVPASVPASVPSTVPGTVPSRVSATVSVALSGGGAGAGSLAAAVPSVNTVVPGVGPQQLVPAQVADPTRLAALTGMDLLQQLSLLPDREIADFVAQHPDAVARLLVSQPSAREVQLWWSGLEMDARSAMLVSAPHIVGNLEGVAFGLRDMANRRVLLSSMRVLSDSVEGGRSKLVDADKELHMLEQVAQALVTEPGGEHRTLLSFDPVGAGRAAIVIGDLAEADYVSFLVPGMFYTADGQMVEWATAAQNLHDTQAAWIAELAEDDARFADATIATVAWIGYETPSLLNFTSLDLAYQGRDALAAAVAGVRTLRADDKPFLSVVAHSYGSIAAMMALTDFGIDIDALAIVGSPGSTAQHAASLGLPGGSVYVGEAPWDQVKDSAFFGTDPGSASFGARVFSVDGGADPISGAELNGSVGHSEYFGVGSESLRNLALVALGQGRLVTTDSGPKLAKLVDFGSREIVAVASR